MKYTASGTRRQMSGTRTCKWIRLFRCWIQTITHWRACTQDSARAGEDILPFSAFSLPESVIARESPSSCLVLLSVSTTWHVESRFVPGKRSVSASKAFCHKPSQRQFFPPFLDCFDKYSFAQAVFPQCFSLTQLHHTIVVQNGSILWQPRPQNF